MTDIFISYSRNDKDFVRRLNKALETRGHDVWVDLEDIPPTAEWMNEIRSDIEGADAFVFVISPDSITSKVCRKELDHAVGHNKRLVPILYREVNADDVPTPLDSRQWISFRENDNFEKALGKLTDALNTDVEWLHEHTHLLTRAIEWDKNKRDNSFVLRGSELRTAEEWQVKAAEKDPKLTPLHRNYILESRRNSSRRQRLALGFVAA